MCGIAGFIADHAAEEDLDYMLAAIVHRGPDEFGTYTAPGIALGTARLSLVDLLHGQQPMEDSRTGVVLVMNGEIFNYQSLRETLVQAGHRFLTHCDTEVVLRLYLEHGRSFASCLNGQFAIAVWDPRERVTLLLRDRFGICPLFYHAAAGFLAFASEIKSLFTHPRVPKQINPFALDQIFTFWTPVGTHTAFADVHELPPGQMMVVQADGQRKQSAYWHWPFPSLQDSAHLSFADAQTELVERLTESIRLRLHADVEVGSYLSGGIDSSAIVALACDRLSRKLRTYSIRFADKSYDESDYQQEVAGKFETTHLAATCLEADIEKRFERVVWHAECPLFRTAPSPLHMLSDAVQQDNLKAILTGEGSDELLLGYDIFREMKIRRFCARQPHSPRRPRLFKKLYSYLPQFANPRYANMAIESLKRTTDPASPFFSHEIRWGNNAANKAFFSDDLRATLNGYSAADELASLLPSSFAEASDMDRAQYLEVTTLLRGYLLSSQGDRMAMSNSVEARFPFLDNEVLRFANSLPENFKLQGLRDKHILRASMRSLLPETITQRPKFAYQAPEIRAFYGAAKTRPAFVEQYLGDTAIRATGLFSSSAVEKLLRKIGNSELTRMGTRDNMAFVQMLSTQILDQRFIKTDLRRSAAGARETCHFKVRIRKTNHDAP